VTQTSEQIAADTAAALRRVARTHKTRADAQRFLLRAGIIEKHQGSRSGVRLAKPYRGTGRSR
jgi:hypothetical protein